MSLEGLAEHDFHRLGMAGTRDATGVLLFLLFRERKFRIVADRGIHERVGQATWDRIGQSLAGYFRDEKYLDGVIAVLTAIGSELEKHFPKPPGDSNELSNSVDVRS